jgi:hypothetical protein
MLLCNYHATSGVAGGGNKKTTISDTDYPRLMPLVNSTSTAQPISLLPKMAEFFHTSNRLLVGHQRRCALSRLYFNSSASGQSVGLSVGWLVGPLVSRSASWPVRRLVGHSVDWLFSRLFGWSVGGPVSRSVGRSVGRLVGRSVGRSVGPQ